MSKLIALAMIYDNRSAGESTINAWHDAAQRARWTYAAAEEAIKAHYAESSEFVMPAHITAHIKRRQSGPPQFDRTQLEGKRRPADPEHIRTTIDWLVTKLGWSQHTQTRRNSAKRYPRNSPGHGLDDRHERRDSAES